ncbi:insulinase (Peptidase family M16) protein [Actinidia rufa]|uniref:Insulinase (Peptidase family M16) protein n=1 Tax=Actinidia rufa TaxID=165716 RepID=A0A7J0FU80_9ERIC|nr:insulinase (Peptidase family M16) protein [Actinidia rufa]
MIVTSPELKKVKEELSNDPQGFSWRPFTSGENHTAPRIVLAASGVEHEELLSVAEPLLSDLPCMPRHHYPASVYVGLEYGHEADLEEIHFILAFEVLGGVHNKKEAVTWMVLQVIYNDWIVMCEFVMRKSKVDTSEIIPPFGFSRSAPSLMSSSNICTLTTWSRLSSFISPCLLVAGYLIRFVFPTFYSFTVLGVPNIRGAARLLRLRFDSIAVVPLLRVGGASLSDTDMALNWAQTLIRDSEALAQFCVNHRIPDDVVIERPGPNDDADWVGGEGNRMPRERLEFTAEDLFHVYCVVKPRRNPKTQMLEGNHYFRLRKPNQPQTRLVTDSPDKDQYLNDFIWVSGQWEFLVDEPDPFLIPRHRGYVPIGDTFCKPDYASLRFTRLRPLYWYAIPLRAARQGRPILPPLQIRRPGSRPRSSLSDDVSDLFEGTSAELRRLLEEAEGESSGSSESSSSSWDIDLGDEALNEEAEVEDGEEVDQVPAALPLVPAPLVLGPEPINLPSSDSDVAIVEPREIVEHFYSHNGSSSFGSQLNAEIMAPKVRILGKKQAPREPLDRKGEKMPDQPLAPPSYGPPNLPLWSSANKFTSADTSKDHETCIALGNAVMLPQDVTDHAVETTTEFGGKLIMLGAQLFQRAVSSSLQLKQAEIAILQQNHAQQEASDLKAFACGEVYKELFDHAFERARDVSHLIIPRGRLLPLQSNSLPLRSDIHQSTCPTSTKRKYAILPADEGNINTAVVEAHAGVAETTDRDRAREAEGDRAIEAEVRYSARAGCLVELASPSPPHSPSIEVLWESCLISRQLSQDLKESVKGRVAALLAVLDDRDMVPLSFRMEG